MSAGGNSTMWKRKKRKSVAKMNSPKTKMNSPKIKLERNHVLAIRAE